MGGGKLGDATAGSMLSVPNPATCKDACAICLELRTQLLEACDASKLCAAGASTSRPLRLRLFHLCFHS